jgi:hypothetical protein
MNDTSPRVALRTGLLLLAVSLPLGLTLEALHAMKVPVYLGSAMRRELWRLAHAHGNHARHLVPRALGTRPATRAGPRQAPAFRTAARGGSVTMPLGFLLGGVLNSEGDPSLGILLVPAGGVLVFVALVQAMRSTPSS